MDKPTVVYLPSTCSIQDLGLGLRARMFVVNHPMWGADYVTTSRIVKMEENGVIETMNTMYRPLADGELDEISKQRLVELAAAVDSVLKAERGEVDA